MTSTEKLKQYINNNYNSIRHFTLENDIPYTTLNSIFIRGLDNSSVRNVSKICTALNISMGDLIFNNNISPCLTSTQLNIENALNITETLLKCGYTLSNGEKLNDKEIQTILDIMKEGLTRAK